MGQPPGDYGRDENVHQISCLGWKMTGVLYVYECNK